MSGPSRRSNDDEMILSRVEPFSIALRQAVHDKQLEQNGIQLLHYVDADVAIAVVDGLLALEDAATFHATQPLLVRSLISAGFVGNVVLTEPHAMELLSHVRTRDDARGTGSRGAFRQRLEAFVHIAGLQGIMDDLRKAIDEARHASSRQALETSLSHLAPEAFVVLEIASGTWEKRLKRCWEHGVFRIPAATPKLRQHVDGLTDAFCEQLTRNRPNFSVNNLHDAIALSSLARAIRSADGRSKQEIRFYSETGAMRRVFQSGNWFNEALCYPTRDDQPERTVDLRSILRDAGYYTLRASITALSFPQAKQSATEGRDVSRMKTLCDEVQDLQNLPRDKAFSAIETIQVGEYRLKDLLVRWQSAALLGNVLSHFEISENVVRMVHHTSEVLIYLRSRNAQSMVHESVREIEGQLEERVRGLSTWLTDVRRIREVLRYLHKTYAGLVPPDPMRDLGLVRWGAPLSAEARRRTREWCDQLIALATRKLTSEAERIATRKQEFASESPEAQLEFCAVLWFLRLFDDIIEAVKLVNSSEDQWSVSLHLMGAAALCSRDAPDDHEAVRHRLDSLREVADRLPAQERAAAGLGLGFCAFYLARKGGLSSRVVDPSTDLTEEGRRFAVDSLEFGKRVVKGLPRGTLEWAFGVNHCAYVSSVFALESSDGRYIDKLVDLFNTDAWHYRFADTVGYHHFLNAYRDWEIATRTNDDRAIVEAIVPVRSELERARKWLTGAQETFGDKEIVQHVHELETLEKVVRARDAISGPPRRRGRRSRRDRSPRYQ